MVFSKEEEKIFKFLEFNFCCQFFLNFFKIFFKFQFFFFFFKFFKFYVKFFKFSNFFSLFHKNNIIYKKYLNKNLKFKIDLNITYFNNFNKLNDFNEVNFFEFSANKFFLKKTINFLKLRIFNIFFLFNYSLFNHFFKYNGSTKLFYLQNITKNVIIIDSLKFLCKWKDAYDFIFNIFYYNFNPLILGNFIFKNEILALNWNYNNFDINFWKYYFSFIIFKINSYNRQTGFFFDKLAFFGVNFFFVTDCSYHFKNLYYLKKKKYFSIGLINATLDPWLVSYPILSFFESFVTQSFFFKLLIFIQKQVFYFKYFYYKTLWFNFSLFNYKQIYFNLKK